MPSLVGSEMCIRDRFDPGSLQFRLKFGCQGLFLARSGRRHRLAGAVAMAFSLKESSEAHFCVPF